MTTLEHSRSTRGLYFLANDAVLDWLIAFLESVRFFNSEMRLVMIPWDDRIRKVGRLASRYRFEILSEDSVYREALAQADEIGRTMFPVHPYKWPAFRKLAVFDGPLDVFLFSDVDVVLLSDPEALLTTFENANADIMFISKSPKCSYADDAFRQTMIEQYGSQEFNSGFWASRKGALSWATLLEQATECSRQPGLFCPLVIDQPFLNYCFDRPRLRRRSFQEALPDLAESHWSNPKREGLLAEENGIYRWARSLPDLDLAGKRVALLHWAGFSLGPRMPFRWAFLKFRLRGMSPWRRTRYLASAWVRDFPARGRQALASFSTRLRRTLFPA